MASYLSSLDGKFSWGQVSDEDFAAGLEKMTVNDPAEHSLGGLTSQLQAYGYIGLANTESLSQIQINGDLSHGYERGSRNSKIDNSMGVKKKGIFHLLSDETSKKKGNAKRN
eukprot:3025761-Ditylum_brightwellii.AAC.1